MSGKSDTRPCPICDVPQTEQYKPFCSKRCADIDLHRWLSGGYAVPVEEDDSERQADLSTEISLKPH